MTHHYHQYVAMSDQRRQQLQHEADQERLLPFMPAMSDYLLAALGQWMVERGTALKQRIQTMPSTMPQWSAESQS